MIGVVVGADDKIDVNDLRLVVGVKGIYCRLKFGVDVVSSFARIGKEAHYSLGSLELHQYRSAQLDRKHV